MAKIKVNITLDEDLMRRVDEYAEENYLNRSSLVSIATTQFLNAADVTKAVKDMAFAMRKIADSGEIDDESRRQLEDFERLSKMLVMSR
jgi:metal-responsive CopG/Arc/MetJ family transcriptional regulator